MGLSMRTDVTFINEEKEFAILWLDMYPLNQDQVDVVLRNEHTILQLERISCTECKVIPKDITSGADWSLWSVFCTLWIRVLWSKKCESASGEKRQMKACRMWPLFAAEKGGGPTQKWSIHEPMTAPTEPYEVILIGASSEYYGVAVELLPLLTRISESHHIRRCTSGSRLLADRRIVGD